MPDAKREAKKRLRREAHIPVARSYTLQLPKKKKTDEPTYHPVSAAFGVDSVTLTTKLGGKDITCKFEYGTTKVDRRVHYHVGWKCQTLRDDAGKPVLVKVPHPCTTCTLTIGGESFSAVGVCKAPDVFNRETGKKFAMRHLLKTKPIHDRLQPKDYELLVRLFLTKPPKPSQIKRVARKMAERQASETPEGVAAKKSVG